MLLRRNFAHFALFSSSVLHPASSSFLKLAFAPLCRLLHVFEVVSWSKFALVAKIDGFARQRALFLSKVLHEANSKSRGLLASSLFHLGQEVWAPPQLA
jgi:hypothetical protein